MNAAAKTTEAPKAASETKPEQELIDAAGSGAESGGQKIADSQRAEVASVVQTEPKTDDAVIVDGNSEVGEEVIDAGEATHVTLNKDVYEKFYFPDTRRPSFRIKFHRGQVVSKVQIEAHNERVKRNQRGELSAEEALRARVDNTTLASGTHPGLGK